jgi:glycosyltransferase involved in cell wall biosynthesis
MSHPVAPRPAAPSVSVIITSLNRPDYLKGACASVLAGRFQDFEILICDDASDKPEARAAATELAASDPRIRVMQNDERRGQFRTIVEASTRISGRHFAILNDDDLWGEAYLEKLVQPLERDSELVASFCDHHIIGPDGEVDPEHTERVSARTHRTELAPGRHENGGYLAFGQSAFPTVVAALFRYSAVDWDRYRSAAMDVTGLYDLWLQACVLSDRSPVWFEPERLSYYRVHGGQASGERTLALAQARAWIWDAALASGDFTEARSGIKRGLWATHHSLGTAYLRRGQLAAARSYLLRACANGPRPKTLFGLLLTSELAPSRWMRERTMQRTG